MNVTSKIRQVKLNEWTSKIADQKKSGLTIQTWCKQNNVSLNSYYYWKHLLKQEYVDQIIPDIVPLSLGGYNPATDHENSIQAQALTSCSTCTTPTTCPSSSKAILFLNGTSIEVDSSISEEFLTTVLRAVRHA